MNAKTISSGDMAGIEQSLKSTIDKCEMSQQVLKCIKKSIGNLGIDLLLHTYIEWNVYQFG